MHSTLKSKASSGWLSAASLIITIRDPLSDSLGSDHGHGNNFDNLFNAKVIGVDDVEGAVVTAVGEVGGAKRDLAPDPPTKVLMPIDSSPPAGSRVKGPHRWRLKNKAKFVSDRFVIMEAARNSSRGHEGKASTVDETCVSFRRNPSLSYMQAVGEMAVWLLNLLRGFNLLSIDCLLGSSAFGRKKTLGYRGLYMHGAYLQNF